MSPADLRVAIGRAYERSTGRPASSALLDTLTAQASLETGRGSQMYNFNFGGIKGAGSQGTANLLTHEVTGGETVTVRQGFRAYASIDEGASDYIHVLSQRFGAAFSKAQAGDVDGFAHALKAAGYYTASEADYVRALHDNTPTSAPTAAGGLLPVPSAINTASGSAYADSDQVSRLIDSLSASALKIAAPSPEDA